MALRSKIRADYPFLWRSENPVVCVGINTGRMLVHKVKSLFLVHELNLYLISLAFAHEEVGAFSLSGRGSWMTGSRNYPVPKHREDQIRPGNILPFCRCNTGSLAVFMCRPSFRFFSFLGVTYPIIPGAVFRSGFRPSSPKKQDAQIHDRSFCAVLEITLADQKSLAYFFLCRRILYDIP